MIRVARPEELQRYRFGLRTADFFICRACGSYLGAVLAEDHGIWSTLNLRLTALSPSTETASYGAEDTLSRIQRRRRVWTPTTVVLVAQ